jgi:hypothetical protein
MRPPWDDVMMDSRLREALEAAAARPAPPPACPECRRRDRAVRTILAEVRALRAALRPRTLEEDHDDDDAR